MQPRSLGIYRVLVGGYFVLFVAPVVRFPAFPSSFFAPPLGPLRLVGAPPHSWFFLIVSAGISVSSVALLLGYRTTIASLAAGLLGFLGDGFVYSFGKIDHNHILLYMVPIVMAASGWGREHSIDRLRGRASPAVTAWPASLLALLLGFMMMSAGLAKLVTGWLDPTTHAAQGQLVINYLMGRHDLLARNLLHVQNGAVWKGIDVATVVFEMGFLVAIVSRTSLRIFCAIAVLFHAGILLTMNIDFSGNLVAYAAFVDWPAVLRLPRHPSSVSGPAGARTWLFKGPGAGLATAVAGGGLCAATWAGGQPLAQLLIRPLHLDPLIPSLVVCSAASLLAVAYIGRTLRDGLRSRVRTRRERYA